MAINVQPATPGDRNLWKTISRVARVCWFGADPSGEVKSPDLLNNETLDCVNAAGTATIGAIGVNVGNWTTLPNTNGVTSASPIVWVEPDTGFSNAGPNTITVAQLLEGTIRRTAGGAQTDTTPTAAQIVAGIPGCVVGTSFTLVVINNSGGAHTLGLGTGVTAATGVTVTLTTASGSAHTFQFRVSNATSGSEAVTCYSFGASAS